MECVASYRPVGLSWFFHLYDITVLAAYLAINIEWVSWPIPAQSAVFTFAAAVFIFDFLKEYQYSPTIGRHALLSRKMAWCDAVLNALSLVSYFTAMIKCIVAFGVLLPFDVVSEVAQQMILMICLAMPCVIRCVWAWALLTMPMQRYQTQDKSEADMAVMRKGALCSGLAAIEI